MRRIRPLPIAVLLATLAVIVVVTLLGGNADAGRREQLQVTRMSLALTDLQSAPFNADRHAGGSPRLARRKIADDERILAEGLRGQHAVDASSALRREAGQSLMAIEGAVGAVYGIAASPAGLGTNPRIAGLQARLTRQSEQLFSALDRADGELADRAGRAHLESTIGTVVGMLLLLVGFSFFYFRSRRAGAAAERLARENEALLGESRVEAATDELTGIGNRRALMKALAGEERSGGREEPELLLAIFDLDGFKQYNDTFGHDAGDELLTRFSGRLSDALGDTGTAYRMGGDEFCVLSRVTPDRAETVLSVAVEALFEEGDGWSVGSSYGAVWMPSEAPTAADALRAADRRMYADKASRSSASRQTTDVLLQVLSEQHKDLDRHVFNVADLSEAVARHIGRPRHEVERIRLAATLHDVGKAAIPNAILGKPGRLSEAEWEFVRCHPVIGERIVSAAPALAATAPLIRATHERFDGLGYPDRLTGEEIPLGARIIAVCDAFDAMTSSRPYREAVDTRAAIDELCRCSGSQFDPSVVEAAEEVLGSRTGTGVGGG